MAPQESSLLETDDLDYLIRMVTDRIKHVEREVAERLFSTKQPSPEYWTSRRNQRDRLTCLQVRLRNEINKRLEER